MDIIIFGSGPMPCDPQFSVLAPGARTWQIAQTVAAALVSMPGFHNLTIFGLEPERRVLPGPAKVAVPVEKLDAFAPDSVTATYLPLFWEDYVRLPFAASLDNHAIPQKADAVIGCASIQPCATAAEFALTRKCPLWIDFFGDAIAEIQSKAELSPTEKEANDTRTIHNWKLQMQALLQGDRFSALSARQRFSVIGQLGVAGRLNRFTKGHELVHTLPYLLFPPDIVELPAKPFRKSPHFTVMWCGSFNTWMDVEPLVEGIAGAIHQNGSIRLMVVGGAVAIYHESSYNEFLAGIRRLGIERSVELLEWQPLSEMRKLYAVCDVGFSIDRFTYEAVLGSRTRVLNFLAAGKPVISTVVTELTADLAEAGLVIPFELKNPADLTRVLLETVARTDIDELAIRARAHVIEHYSGIEKGEPLIEWLREPSFAPDKSAAGTVEPGNPLNAFWERVRGLT